MVRMQMQPSVCFVVPRGAYPRSPLAFARSVQSTMGVGAGLEPCIVHMSVVRTLFTWPSGSEESGSIWELAPLGDVQAISRPNFRCSSTCCLRANGSRAIGLLMSNAGVHRISGYLDAAEFKMGPCQSPYSHRGAHAHSEFPRSRC